MKLPLLLLAALLPLGLQAQTPSDIHYETVHSTQYQLQYRVPAGWDQLRQTTDSTIALTYLSPARDLVVYIGQLRGAADRLTPDQALYQLTEQFGVPVNKQFATAYNGIPFLETTGMGTRDGLPMRYDALAARHRGHVLLICVSGSPDAFLTHEPVVQHMLHSLTPYKPRRATGK
ncbi:hypothetical protein EJV47_01405 [Hymenobacter gummosus]|uniref:DUF1795 domain-containing protein n=1 Tax=Hymenobacter gummosus TaxID=1776032 RepID=A0A3S0JKJ2_9BACT|nr:hypothetical protein [Hymenobacter gummosus]RTQ53424.1 hypothetical protein EJV47_01405 [Hymenobacter gummosus]